MRGRPSGLQPDHVGELPPQCAALNRTFLNVGELTVRAALDGRPRPRTARRDARPEHRGDPHAGRIDALVDEMLDAHGAALPEGIGAGAATGARS